MLGLDLGERRIGVAVSDDERRLALPHSVLLRAGGEAGWPADHGAIQAIVEETGAVLVVVGLPVTMAGSSGAAATSYLREIEHLSGAVGARVATCDERLTTVVAHRRLAETGMSGRRRRGAVDASAAAVILEGFLERDRRPDSGGRADSGGWPGGGRPERGGP
ncbi:MAG: Holliday junction resolvase RuvX [Acidimicrobiales bacterium]